MPEPQVDTAELPLTQAQLGIWKGQKLAGPDSAIYNTAEAVELSGELNTTAFERVLKQVIGEADALNCIFTERNDEPVQCPAQSEWRCAFHDFSMNEESEALAGQWLQAETGRPFALDRESPYRTAVLKIGPSRYFWYLCIHHIACDGYGFALLQKRALALYEAARTKTLSSDRSQLAPLSPVIEEDAQYQNSAARDEDQRFWRVQMADMKSPVSLSPSQAAFAGPPHRRHTFISAELRQALDLRPLPSCNWSHTLIAAVAYCVYRRTGSNEIVLGLPVMNRARASLRAPAMLMNIIPLRLRIDTAKNFGELVGQVAQLMAATRPHQRYRYEHLRRDLGLIGGGQRLFGPVVNIMPFDRDLRIHSQRAKVHSLSAGPVEDLSFAFVATADGGLDFTLEANPARYSQQEIAGLQHELFDWLCRACRSDTPLLPDYRYLSWLQGPALPQANPDVMQLIELAAQKHGQHCALADSDGEITYGQLWQHVEQRGNALRRLGVRPGSLVALCLPRGREAITLMLAVLHCRAAFLFIDPVGPAERNKKILADVGASVVLFAQPDPVLTDAAWECVTIESLSRPGKALPDVKGQNLPEAAYLIYTSGSTGSPKGVVVGRKALNDFVAGAQQVYGVTAEDRVLQFAPMQFDACIEEIFLTLCRGATLVLRADSMLESMEIFLAECHHKSLSVLDLPTAFWHELVHYLHRTDAPWPHSVRTVIIGGEAAQPERVAQWRQRVPAGVRLWNTYGPSEATVVATCSALHQDVDVTIGRPLPGRIALVLDEHHQLTPKGVAGELSLAGVSLAEGYLGAPEKTAASFLSLEPRGKPPLRVYETGDRVRVDGQGNLEYLGRIDDEIKISGQRISPAEIEAALRADPEIEDCAVMAIGQNLHTFICAQREPDIAALKTRLREKLPAVMIPSAFTRLDRLPLTASNKVDKPALAALIAAEPETRYDEPAEQALVRRVWQEVLGMVDFGDEDDFFLLGGQSLQTIKVANRLSAELGREVPVTTLFEYPSLAGLAGYLADGQTTHTAADMEVRLIADTRLPESLKPQTSISLPGPWQTVLMTGATGFVGAHLLAELLTTTTATVVCLLRARDALEGLERIGQALARQGLNINGWQHRIEIVPGDLEAENLGLEAATWSGLQERVQAIFHNAAITSVLRDYDSLKYANTLSCRTLLALGAKTNIPLHFISSIAVGQGCRELPEAGIDFHAGLADGYQQSKWVAERLLQNAVERGFNVTIYRLARVVGPADTGEVNAKDLMWNILRASAGAGLLPELSIAEPWTPVDTVCRTVVSVARRALPDGVYNLTPEHLVRLDQLGLWLNEAGFVMQTVPMPQWLARLRESNDPRDQALLAFFDQRRAQEKVELPLIANQQARCVMREHGLRFAALTRESFDRYLTNAKQQGLFSPEVSI